MKERLIKLKSIFSESEFYDMSENIKKSNRIFEDDQLAIQWLMKKIDEEKYPIFAKSTAVLLKYAKRCLEDLKKKDFSNNEIDEKIIINVKERLQNKEFLTNCLKDNNELEEKYSLNTLTQEEIDKIQQLTDEEIEKIVNADIDEISEEEKKFRGKIIQVNRFYNMQLKYAHTARTVYVAEEILKKMEMKNENLSEIVLTGAALHDVGRFYQALEYDSFLDNEMRDDKSFKFSEEYVEDKNHASAGYYYSMMSLFEMNNMNDNMNDKEAFINLIVSFVVRFHQRSNNQMELFDISTEEMEKINVSLEGFEKILVNSIYENSPVLNVEERHKEYIREVLEEILKQKIVEKKIIKANRNVIIDNIMKKIDKPGEQEDYLKKISDFIEKRKNGQILDMSELTEEFIEIIGDEIEISENEEKKYKSVLASKIIEMIDYDVASGIYKTFETMKSNEWNKKYNKNLERIELLEQEIHELDKKITKDGEAGFLRDLDYAEKVNIELISKKKELEQRIKTKENMELEKKENEEINIEDYKIFFSFPLNLVTDADKIDIFNQRALKTYPTSYAPEKLPVIINEEITNYDGLFEELEIVDEKEKSKIIEDEDNKDNRGGVLEKGDIIFVPSDKVYEFMKSEDRNISSENKKIQVILPDDYLEKFHKYDGIKFQGLGTVGSLIATLNQFVFTNIRTKAALEIIKENKFLERTYSNYSEEIREYIKPYMQYTLYYIDEMIKNEHEIFNAEIMKAQSEEIYGKYQKLSDKEKSYYANRLDEDRLNEGINY